MAGEVIVIVDLGCDNNDRTREELESLGVKAVVCRHDITREELDALGDVKGLVLNGGPAKKVNGFRLEASEDIYESGLPAFTVDHASWLGVDLFMWPKEKEERLEKLKRFLKNKCRIDIE